jgi:uncharacterized repeat protein (TIGR01451 family)
MMKAIFKHSTSVAFFLSFAVANLRGQVDHFGVSAIPSPQFVNMPFTATITALDSSNNVATNFTGTANLSALALNVTRTNMILGNPTHVDYESSVGTVGYAFVPNANLTVTHVRSYFGSKVSIWTSAGVLLASQNVSSIPGTWVETPLPAPLQLNAGNSYRVAVYSAGNVYWGNDLPSTFADGTIYGYWGAIGDTFPTNSTWAKVPGVFVDLRYTVGPFSAPLPVSPFVSGAFNNGVWSGNIALQAPAASAILIADDGHGHTNASNPLSVALTNDISITAAAAPGPASGGSNLTYTLSVFNTGPTDATGTMVSNFLPANVAFVSATSSQGTCSRSGPLVVGNLGVVPAGSNAIVTIVVVPTLATTNLTNVATVSRAEQDAFLGNNTATVVTPVAVPAISISDSSCVEPTTGTTNMLFSVTLNVPSAIPVYVNYPTANGTAAAGRDYIAESGSVAFMPGVTNQTIAVPVLGSIAVGPNKTFFMNSSGPPYGGTLVRSQAVGSILNSNGLPGQIYYFNWSTIASPQLTGQPFPVTIAALDYSNNLATNFTGAVSLSASVGGLGTNTILGNRCCSPYWSLQSTVTVGYSITPNANLTVTQVRSYSGSKVSIWTDAGVLLASQNVSNIPNTWVETPLSSPLQLNAGNTYRIAYYTGSSPDYYSYDMTNDFADGTINQSYYGFGDAFPVDAVPGQLFAVDLRYTIAVPIALPSTPSVSGAFSNGVWSGNVTIQAPATNAILSANDGNGHLGLSNPFNVITATPPTILVQPVSQTVLGGSKVTFSVSATGTPPLSYFWQKDTLPLLGVSGPSLTLLNVARNYSGTYNVVVTNIAGGTISSNAVLTVHVPQMLANPTFSSDGTLVLTASDVDGGTISAAEFTNFTAQASSNFVNWVDLPGALTLTNGTLQLNDVGSTNSPVQFYRIIEKW